MLMMNRPDPPPLILLKGTVSLLSRKISNDRTLQQIESYPDVLHLWLTVTFCCLVTISKKTSGLEMHRENTHIHRALGSVRKEDINPHNYARAQRLGEDLSWTDKILGFDTCKWSLTVLTVFVYFWLPSEGRITQKTGITHHVCLYSERWYLDRQE